ncbi:hypothetical protein P0136_12435 [Lentisphaerota bacterium ZTH]|nr:hypothetical protein JYG24_10050 [Lentisphaerota bacterium]WET06165.1 hypothetical protein P0136_12435 [Lentisphaerota bacterium ZTH]
MNKEQYEELLSEIAIFEKIKGKNHSASKNLPIFKSLLSHCRNIEEIYRKAFNEKSGMLLGDELVREYCASAVTQNTVRKIYTGIGADFVTDKIINNKIILLNSCPGSFKQYVKYHYYKLTSCRRLQASYASCIAENDDEISIDMKYMDYKKTLGVSAHAVKMYKGKAPYSGLFFGKSFRGEVLPAGEDKFRRLFDSSVSHRTQEKERAVAEVFYAKAWRYLLGKQVSASLIMRGEGAVKPVGICSKGLTDFVEYHDIIRSEEMMHESLHIPGLIAITVLAYLLMEDDLHVMNLGWTNVDGKRVFGKIDHDYLTADWKNNWAQNQLVRQFDINYLLNFIRRPSYDTLKVMMKRMRFSPGTQNSVLWRTGSYLRQQATSVEFNGIFSGKPIFSQKKGKSDNTINLARKRYFKYEYVPHNEDELHETAYRLSKVDVSDFHDTMRNHIGKIEKMGINPAFAITILDCIKARLQAINTLSCSNSSFFC